MMGQAKRSPRAVADQGEAATFDGCYLQHRDAVYRLCLRYASGRAGFAEDVTQEVFIRLFQNFGKIDRTQPISDWLYAVASRACISHLRRDRSLRGLLARLVHREAAETASTAQLFEHREAAAGVMAAIDGLPPQQRVAICMRAFDGKSQKEIASILRVSEGYVSRLIAAARAKLTERGWENIE
jgi:RNA polymerase sigma-70 factor (ECF subfamily)